MIIQDYRRAMLTAAADMGWWLLLLFMHGIMILRDDGLRFLSSAELLNMTTIIFQSPWKDNG